MQHGRLSVTLGLQHTGLLSESWVFQSRQSLGIMCYGQHWGDVIMCLLQGKLKQPQGVRVLDALMLASFWKSSINWSTRALVLTSSCSAGPALDHGETITFINIRESCLISCMMWAHVWLGQGQQMCVHLNLHLILKLLKYMLCDIAKKNYF